MAPSGTGKSTLIRGLHDRFGWRVVRKVTTRPQRGEEDWKTTVSETEFWDLDRRGLLFNTKPAVFGHLYAELREDFERAVINEREAWVMDSTFEYIDFYENVVCKKVLLLHRRSLDTVRQILADGRNSRLAEVRNERRAAVKMVRGIRRRNDLSWMFSWYTPDEFDSTLECVVKWANQVPARTNNLSTKFLTIGSSR